MIVYGIQKEMTNNYGQTYDHHAVHAIQLSSTSAAIIFASWLNFAARLSGAQPMPGTTKIVPITFQELGLYAPMTSPMEEMAQTIMNYALANVEEFEGGQIVSQNIG